VDRREVGLDMGRTEVFLHTHDGQKPTGLRRDNIQNPEAVKPTEEGAGIYKHTNFSIGSGSGSVPRSLPPGPRPLSRTSHTTKSVDPCNLELYTQPGEHAALFGVSSQTAGRTKTNNPPTPTHRTTHSPRCWPEAAFCRTFAGDW